MTRCIATYIFFSPLVFQNNILMLKFARKPSNTEIDLLPWTDSLKFFIHLYFFLLAAGERSIPPPRTVHHWKRPIDSNSEGQEGRAESAVPAPDQPALRKHVMNKINPNL